VLKKTCSCGSVRTIDSSICSTSECVPAGSCGSHLLSCQHCPIQHADVHLLSYRGLCATFTEWTAADLRAPGSPSPFLSSRPSLVLPTGRSSGGRMVVVACGWRWRSGRGGCDEQRSSSEGPRWPTGGGRVMNLTFFIFFQKIFVESISLLMAHLYREFELRLMA
jgi:hypothetical protein